MSGRAAEADVPGPELVFLSAFHRALSEIPPGATLLYSGGLDSSLIAYCMGHPGRAPPLVVVGVGDAPDVLAAIDGAARLGLPLRVERFTGEEARERLLGAMEASADRPEPLRSVRLAFELAVRAAGCPAVICGQGADELFGGYARYRGRNPAEAARLRTEDLERLDRTEWPWAERLGRQLGVRIFAPYLAPEVREAALAVPWPIPTLGPLAKDGLRELARCHGLPEPIALRPKRALQYGSRVRAVLGAAPSRSHEPL